MAELYSRQPLLSLAAGAARLPIVFQAQDARLEPQDPAFGAVAPARLLADSPVHFLDRRCHDLGDAANLTAKGLSHHIEVAARPGVGDPNPFVDIGARLGYRRPHPFVDVGIRRAAGRTTLGRSDPLPSRIIPSLRPAR